MGWNDCDDLWAPSTTGSAYLEAELADRILFVCKNDHTQTWQVSTRHAIIGFALLMGWAALASSGLMPPSWANAHARSQMKIVVQHFDLTTIFAPVAMAQSASVTADAGTNTVTGITVTGNAGAATQAGALTDNAVSASLVASLGNGGFTTETTTGLNSPFETAQATTAANINRLVG